MGSKIAVIYYSATGNVHNLAVALAEGAEAAGAEVRLRRAQELAPMSAIEANEGWFTHHTSVAAGVQEAQIEDLAWADGYAFGTPTRFGNPAAQLKQFIDQAGGLWAEGALANKVATTFTSSHNRHGGQESTILALNNVLYHWGSVIVPPGYTDPVVFDAGGNPYGTSHYEADNPGGISMAVLAAARYQGRRLACFADIVRSRSEREHGAGV